MAKGQKRSNREKKKPKQDKNKKKGVAPTSSFGSALIQGRPVQGYGAKKTP